MHQCKTDLHHPFSKICCLVTTLAMAKICYGKSMHALSKTCQELSYLGISSRDVHPKQPAEGNKSQLFNATFLAFS